MGRLYDPRDRAYRAWRTAIRTAHRTKAPFYQPWREAFDNFLADMGEPPAGAHLRRHDTSGPFSPANCYWS